MWNLPLVYFLYCTVYCCIVSRNVVDMLFNKTVFTIKIHKKGTSTVRDLQSRIILKPGAHNAYKVIKFGRKLLGPSKQQLCFFSFFMIIRDENDNQETKIFKILLCNT